MLLHGGSVSFSWLRMLVDACRLKAFHWKAFIVGYSEPCDASTVHVVGLWLGSVFPVRLFWGGGTGRFSW